MKEEKMQIIDFDEIGYAKVLADLEGLAKQLNNRPYDGNDPLSLRAQVRSGIVNECFKSSCEKIGLTPSLELLKNVLNKNPQQVAVIILDEVKAELNKQTGIHDALKPSILKGYESEMAELNSVISRLNQSYSFMNRPAPGIPKRLYQIENYLSFI